MLGRLGRHDEAASLLRDVTPRLTEPRLQYLAQLFLGTEEAATGHLARAREAFERAAVLFPTAQSPLVALADVAWRAGARAEALDALRRLEELPDDTEAREESVERVLPLVRARRRRTTGRRARVGRPKGAAVTRIKGITSAPARARAEAWRYEEDHGRGAAHRGRRRARFLSIVLLPWALLAPQAPLFRATVEAVRVDVLVTEGGHWVPGLTPADFEVLDNGVPQRIDQAVFEEVPLNLVIALDGSASVEGTRAEHLRAACHRALDHLRPDEKAGLIVFSDALLVPRGLTGNLAEVHAAIDEPLPLGDTSLADASYAALLLAESQPGRSLVVIFTDGVEVTSYLGPEAVLEAAKRSDAVMYGVAVESAGRPRFLKDLTGASGGDVFEYTSADQLEETFVKILEEFRHRYLFSYTPTGVERAGWHRLEVRVKRGGVSVKTRPGYFRD